MSDPVTPERLAEIREELDLGTGVLSGETAAELLDEIDRLRIKLGEAAPVCTIEGCDKTLFCRRMCSKHYQRWQRHGDPYWAGPDEIDDAAVERAVMGDPPDRLTVAERREVVRRLHRNGLTDGQIVQHLDVGASAVQAMRRRLGLPANAAGRRPYKERAA